MTQSSREIVLYWFDRARQTLEEAQMLADAGRWNLCVNRLYYACFYAVSALLVKGGLASSKHMGAEPFQQALCENRKSAREVARIYNDLFERRQEGDYIDFVFFKETDVIPWIPDARRFVEHITALAQN